MVMAHKLVLICFDISCDKRRTKVCKILEKHFVRVQESVFEGLCNLDFANEIVEAASQEILFEDSLRFYVIAASEIELCKAWGLATAPNSSGALII